MTYRLFSALSLSLPADGDEYSVSIEPAQVLLHGLSDHTVVLSAETCDKKNMGDFKHFKLEIRVSQNLAKLGEEAHKMSGMEGEENWSTLGSLGG